MKSPLLQVKLTAAAKRSHRGLSLVEIVTSLTIMSVLVVAMGSALLVASRGMPDPNSPLADKISSVRVIDQIATELQYAFTINSASSTAIEFIVERKGSPVTISYSWSGTAGDPLLRQYNGGAIINLLPAISDFNLSYEIGSTAVGITIPVEGSEIELVKYEPVTYISKYFYINTTDWPGQYFKPTLPDDAVSWRVTRVVFRAMSFGVKNGLTRVNIHTADVNNLPTTTIIERASMNEADLTSFFTWRQFTFSDVANLAPGDGLCLVLEWALNGTSAIIDYVKDPSGFIETNDAGSSWVEYGDSSMIYYVYGKVTMPGLEIYPINSVRIGLDTGLADTTRLQTTALLLNQPASP